MFPGFRRVSAVASAAAIVIGGCGPNTSGIQGISCTADSDCNSGLSCLNSLVEADAGEDAGCTSIGSQCLQPCHTNSDCTEQGYFCFTACGGTPACLPVVPGMDAAVDAMPGAPSDGASDAPVDVASQ
jgi:hypothetical protein